MTNQVIIEPELSRKSRRPECVLKPRLSVPLGQTFGEAICERFEESCRFIFLLINGLLLNLIFTALTKFLHPIFERASRTTRVMAEIG
jgi:hypothetical protein